MALYLIGKTLVSAKNGPHAQELAGSSLSPQRVDNKPHGVIGEVEPEQSTEPVEEHEPREVDVTTIEDRGIRRFKNLDTGEERTEPR